VIGNGRHSRSVCDLLGREALAGVQPAEALWERRVFGELLGELVGDCLGQPGGEEARCDRQATYLIARSVSLRVTFCRRVGVMTS
jgi:hypothetical protein